MGENKKKGSKLPPYTGSGINKAANSVNTLPKGLIKVKENRELIHSDSVSEGLAYFSFKDISPNAQAEEKGSEQSDRNEATQAKKK